MARIKAKSYVRKNFNVVMAEKIMKQLNSVGAAQISERQLQEKIKSRSKSDFSDCLYFLEKYGVISRNKENWRPGQKIILNLTETGKQILRFGIIRVFLAYIHKEHEELEGHKDIIEDEISFPYTKKSIAALTKKEKKEKDSPEERRLKIIYKFLVRGAYGVSCSQIVDIRETEVQAGDIRLDDFHSLRIIRYEEGVSGMDLVEQRDNSFAGIFAYVRPRKEEVEEPVHVLVAEGLIEKIGVVDGEIRFGIVDNGLKEYIEEWVGLHQDIFTRMKNLVCFLRGTKRGTRDDIEIVNYFVEHMGGDNTWRFFSYANQLRKQQFTSTGHYSNPKLNKKWINSEDKQILFYKQKIERKKKKYQVIEKKYPVVTRIIKMHVIPDFLIDILHRLTYEEKRQMLILKEIYNNSNTLFKKHRLAKRMLELLYSTNKWYTEHELAHELNILFLKKEMHRFRETLNILLNRLEYLEVDDIRRTDFRIRLSKKGKKFIDNQFSDKYNLV